MADLVLYGSLVFLVVLYFLPTVAAVLFHHGNAAAIFILNLLLGWTGLGWVAALVWSFTNNRRPAEGGGA